MADIITPKMFGQQLDFNQSTAHGIEVLYRFIPGTGNLPDESGNENHGTFGGDPKWVGDGLFFDGDDFVDLEVTEFDGTSLFCESTQKFTVSCEFKATTASSIGTLVSKAQSGTSTLRTFQIFLINDPAVIVTRLRGSQTMSTFEVGVDRHVAVVTWDGTTAKLYVDGVFLTLLDVGVAVEETTENVILGARTGGTAFFLDGQIYDTKIYNRALSASEIQALYINPNLPFSEEPIWMYHQAVVGGIVVLRRRRECA